MLHYTFGHFNGTIVDDEGNKIEVKDLPSQVEIANNKW